MHIAFEVGGDGGGSGGELWLIDGGNGRKFAACRSSDCQDNRMNECVACMPYKKRTMAASADRRRRGRDGGKHTIEETRRRLHNPGLWFMV